MSVGCIPTQGFRFPADSFSEDFPLASFSRRAETSDSTDSSPYFQDGRRVSDWVSGEHMKRWNQGIDIPCESYPDAPKPGDFFQGDESFVGQVKDLALQKASTHYLARIYTEAVVSKDRSGTEYTFSVTAAHFAPKRPGSEQERKYFLNRFGSHFPASVLIKSSLAEIKDVRAKSDDPASCLALHWYCGSLYLQRWGSSRVEKWDPATLKQTGKGELPESYVPLRSSSTDRIAFYSHINSTLWVYDDSPKLVYLRQIWRVTDLAVREDRTILLLYQDYSLEIVKASGKGSEKINLLESFPSIEGKAVGFARCPTSGKFLLSVFSAEGESFFPLDGHC